MQRRGKWAAGVCTTLAVAVLALRLAGPAIAATPVAPGAAPVRLLDVPYVPQSAALCGGAAVAMVLRYWGDRDARAEDFAPWLTPNGDGIPANALVAAVRARGWTALPITGTAPAVQDELAHDRPVIALVRVQPGGYHYVVLLAWANGGVILHDPARAPFRTSDARAFAEAWAASGNWALLVLPPARAPGLPLAQAADSASAVAPPPALAGCDAIVDDAIARAHAGDAAGAESRLLSAAALCPASAAPLRGLAGLRFAARDWAGASRLAQRALALDPTDDYTWRLLGASRFLADDETGALRAWNHVAEPRADLVRVDGLVRIPYRAVAGQLGLPAGQIVTAGAFTRARRRLAEIPAQASARLRLTPLAEGSAQLNAAVLERPLLFGGPLEAGGAALHALVAREASLQLASPTGNGELWSVDGSWRHERPRAALVLTAPAGGSHPGTWRVEGSWERQAYALAGGVQREERRRTALAFADWITPGIRLEAGPALDRWSGRGAHVALEAALDARAADDRLALGARAGQWTSLERGAPFRGASLAAQWGPRAGDDAGWLARAAVFHASAAAPLALWPGAGTGTGRAALLRAHPLLADGVVAGRAFGHTLADLGLERAGSLGTAWTMHLGWSAFVDAARAWQGVPGARPATWLVDGGVSLRVRAPGAHGAVRATAAHGFVDGAAALSVAWEAP